MKELRALALDVLRVTGRHAADTVEVNVIVDEYVPLRFRTSREPLGVGYVRLGNYTDTLLELKVDPRSQAIRGLTVTSFVEISQWPAFAVREAVQGLPVLSTSFGGGEVVDLPHEFEIATRPGEVIAFWSELAGCSAYAVDKTRFLVVNNVLAGVLFGNMTDEEIRIFESHVPSRAKLPRVSVIDD